MDEEQRQRITRDDELGVLVTATRESLDEHRRGTVINGVAAFLYEETSHQTCAELLALALTKLADHHRRGPVGVNNGHHQN
jgi:hypothetical protein